MATDERTQSNGSTPDPQQPELRDKRNRAEREEPCGTIGFLDWGL